MLIAFCSWHPTSSSKTKCRCLHTAALYLYSYALHDYDFPEIL